MKKVIIISICLFVSASCHKKEKEDCNIAIRNQHESMMSHSSLQSEMSNNLKDTVYYYFGTSKHKEIWTDSLKALKDELDNNTLIREIKCP